MGTVSHDGLLISGLRTMLILLIVAIAFEILAFLILLPHNLLMAIIGAITAGTIGIVVTGAVLALRGGSSGEKSNAVELSPRLEEELRSRGEQIPTQEEERNSSKPSL